MDVDSYENILCKKKKKEKRISISIDMQTDLNNVETLYYQY